MADGYLNFNTKIKTEDFEKGIRRIEISVGKIEKILRSLVETITNDLNQNINKAEDNLEQVESSSKDIAESAKEVNENVDETSDNLEQIEGSSKNINKTTTNVFKKIGSIYSGLKNVKKIFLTIAKLVASAFSVKMLIDFGKKAIELASDIEEVQNVVDVSFGDMAYRMEAFADSAIEMYGISKLAAKQTGSTFMAMASGMGLASEAAADMSLQLTALSADMASFYNKTQEETAGALKSVFTGETEALKQYGIVMTETNLQAFAYSQGIQKNISAMTQAEKVQLRYNFVMQQTALAQGDFARTSGSWANQVKLVKMQFEEFASSLGIIFKNILLPAVHAINQILSYLISGATTLVQVFSKLFGWETDTASSTKEIEQNTSDTLDNEKKTTSEKKKQNKEAQKLLGTYDKLDVIQQDTADSADEASSALGDLLGGTNGGYDIKGTLDLDTSKADSKIDEIVKKVKNMFKSSDFSELGNNLRDKIVEALTSVDFSKITEKGNTIAKSITTFINGLFDPKNGEYVLGESIGKFIADALSSAINIFDTYVWEFDSKDLGANVSAGLQTAFDEYDWSTLGHSLSGIVVKGLNFTTGLVNGINWSELPSQIKEKISEFLGGIEWAEISKSLGETIGSVMKGAGEFFSSLWKGIKEGAKQYFMPYIEEAGGNIFLGVLNGILDGIKNIKNWIKTNIFNPFIEGFKNAFGINSPAKEMKPMGRYIIDGLLEGIGNLWDKLKGKFNQLLKDIKQWFKEKKGELTEKWLNFTSGIKGRTEEFKAKIAQKKAEISEKWRNHTANIKGRTEEFKAKVATKASEIKEKWNELTKQAKDKTATLKMTFSDRVSSAIKSIIESIVNFLNNAIGKFNKVLPKKYEISPIEMPTWRAPKLATGMVVPANYGEFAAILGDNRKAPEIVSPIPDMQKAMAEVLEKYGSGSKAPIILQVGRKVIAQATWDESEKRYKQTGRY